MAAFTDYLENQVLNTLRGTNITAPTDVYIGLFTTAPTDTTPGTEPTDAAYARQVITFSVPAQESGKATIKNNSEITFSAATELWGNVGWFGIFDALTSGNMLVHGALTTAKTIETDDQVKIQTNEAIVRLD